VNKRTLVKKIVQQLTEERALLFRAATAARAEATDEQSKAENKYDTRGLEASYLARGQARHVAEVEQAIEQFESLELRQFGPGVPVDVGAVVELKSKRTHSFYFIGPRSGGTEVQLEKKEILVITPLSPLGQQLIGKKAGDRLALDLGGERQEYDLVAVS
jgi:transcription elongation GreA/GreB family factor